MKNTCYILLFAVITSLFLSTGAFAAPAEADSELPEGLEDYIARQFEESHIPGMSLEIVSGDKVLFAENYGEAASCDQPFMLGSLSKSFTAVAIMQLEEQGLLSLTAPWQNTCLNLTRAAKQRSISCSPRPAA